jgi:hypothetical protein
LRCRQAFADEVVRTEDDIERVLPSTNGGRDQMPRPATEGGMGGRTTAEQLLTPRFGPHAFPEIIFLPALTLGCSECVVKRIELEDHQLATSAIELI